MRLFLSLRHQTPIQLAQDLLVTETKNRSWKSQKPVSRDQRDQSSTHSSEVGSCFTSSRRAFFPGDDFAAARDDVTLVLLRDFDAV